MAADVAGRADVPKAMRQSEAKLLLEKAAITMAPAAARIKARGDMAGTNRIQFVPRAGTGGTISVVDRVSPPVTRDENASHGGPQNEFVSVAEFLGLGKVAFKVSTTRGLFAAARRARGMRKSFLAQQGIATKSVDGDGEGSVEGSTGDGA